MEERGCSSASERLLEGAAQLGVALTFEQRKLFIRYCQLILETNEHTNITAARDPLALVTTLFLDALTLCPVIPLHYRDGSRAVRAVDVGTGAGAPGLPLKIIYPHWSLTLVESVQKKARFVQSVVSALGLSNVSVVGRRAEEVVAGPPLRDAADICVARAVARLTSLVELCAPFVRPRGLLLFPKGASAHAEIGEAKGALRALRVRVVDVVPIPESLYLGTGHVVVVCEKLARTPAGYPRRIGMAQRQPLTG